MLRIDILVLSVYLPPRSDLRSQIDSSNKIIENSDYPIATTRGRGGGGWGRIARGPSTIDLKTLHEENDKDDPAHRLQ